MTYIEAIQKIENANKRKKLYPLYLRMERLALLFAKLNIDPSMPAVHITGTSGKGSTSSLSATVLQAAGYKVGLHTTPHLQTPRERMQVNGLMPSEKVFTQLSERVYKTALLIEDSHSFGAFNGQELLFTIAYLHFQRQKVDIAIVETFMGGQYDPTNIVKPLVSVVTNVDLDHTKVLGNSIESIAMVKAGVIKTGIPFVTGASQPSVIDIFKKRCRDVEAPCFVVGEGDEHQSRLLGLSGSLLSAKVLNNLFSNLRISLLGPHQVNNALMSLYILQVLRSRGWLIPDIAIREGFSATFIPGRFELVNTKPLIVLDGAHNPAKTRALASTLRRVFRGRKIIFVFAMKKGKDLERSLKFLTPLGSYFVVTRFSAKSKPTSDIRHFLKKSGAKSITRLDPTQAIEFALRKATENDIICVTGSLYLVGYLRSYWYPDVKENSVKANIKERVFHARQRS